MLHRRCIRFLCRYGLDRPGKLWINLGLEWFIRLVKEPWPEG